MTSQLHWSHTNTTAEKLNASPHFPPAQALSPNQQCQKRRPLTRAGSIHAAAIMAPEEIAGPGEAATEASPAGSADRRSLLALGEMADHGEAHSRLERAEGNPNHLSAHLQRRHWKRPQNSFNAPDSWRGPNRRTQTTSATGGPGSPTSPPEMAPPAVPDCGACCRRVVYRFLGNVVFFCADNRQWSAFQSCSQFSSVARSCPTLCDPIDCSTPGFPLHHQLPELAQTYVHRVGEPHEQYEKAKRAALPRCKVFMRAEAPNQTRFTAGTVRGERGSTNGEVKNHESTYSSIFSFLAGHRVQSPNYWTAKEFPWSI